MNKADVPESIDVAPVLAARMLSMALGESQSTWSMRLANGRRPDRVSPVAWRTNAHGNPTYNSKDIQQHIDLLLSKRAVGAAVDESDELAKATAVADIESERAYVWVFWNARTAQGAFGMSISAAEAFSAKLSKALEAAKARSQQADLYGR